MARRKKAAAPKKGAKSKKPVSRKKTAGPKKSQTRKKAAAKRANAAPKKRTLAKETGTATNAASYVEKMSEAIRVHFAGSSDLATFLSGVTDLNLEQRKSIVRQALILIEQNYAHLPGKRAMYSVDPVQRLKLLMQTLELESDGPPLSDREFHAEMTDIFTSVRDLHTIYLLPDPFAQMAAFLPFLVEDYFENGVRKYLVSYVAQGVSHPTFRPGVEVTFWNGMPIERAVAVHAERFAGSNRDARHARGVETLTSRALQIAPPPDEEWVVVGYRTEAGEDREQRFDWQVNPPLPSLEGGPADAAAAACLGIDLEQDIVQRLRLALFAPQKVAAKRAAEEKAEQGGEFGELESMLPHVFEARAVETPSGAFGYLRIWTFNYWPPRVFVDEFIRLIGLLPQSGLIIDVRGNGGGIINNGELILQTLTPKRIEPEPLQFVNSPLNLEICRQHGPTSHWADLEPWVESLQLALRTGAAFSAGFPITEPEACNAIGQKYFGPVVLITDALCYSTTDIFAAGFQDHGIGVVLGTHGNTGAGGANVWQHHYFVNNVLPGSVYHALPNGAGMAVAIRRTLRVGRKAGTPLEDLGVIPNRRHFMTRRDLLEGNVDLIDAAGAVLAEEGTPRAFSVRVLAASPMKATVIVESRRLDRLDVYLDDRPFASMKVADGETTFTIDKESSDTALLELRGFENGRLAARYRTFA